MAYLIAADFELGETYTRFDRLLFLAGEYGSPFNLIGLEHPPEEFVEFLDTLDEGIRQSTWAIMKNDWFWTFSAEVGWEVDRESNLASVGIDWFLDSTEHASKIEDWLRALGAINVQSIESDAENMDEWC